MLNWAVTGPRQVDCLVLMAATGKPRILVIKLGALGDFVQAMGPFAAIRQHHADAHIVLLTSKPFDKFIAASGWFDETWIDSRPPWRGLLRWIALSRKLRRGHFERVYDLQTSDRSSLYFHLMAGFRRPQWSGIARGCSHRHKNPERDEMHTIERQAEQLAVAGIADVPVPNLSWVQADTARFGLNGRYVLIAPGGSAHRPEKRWPAGFYTELARNLVAKGITPLLIGTLEDAHATGTVGFFCEGAVDLTSDTSLAEIVALARGAEAAVGNDTGPMHLIAATGTRSIVLYSDESDPALCAQRGPDVTILRRPLLTILPVDEVEAALRLG